MTCTGALALASLASRPDPWVVVGATLLGGFLTIPTLWLWIVVHEATHALCAWVLGMRLLGVRAGGGPLLARFRALSCEWLVGSLPGDGHVKCRLTSDRWFRTRWILVYLSAPCVCVGIAVWCIHAALPILNPFQPPAWGVVTIPVWFLLFMSLGELLPIRSRERSNRPEKDVLAAMRLLRLDDEGLQRILEESREDVAAHSRWNLFRTGRAREALALEEAAVSADPGRLCADLPVFLWAVEGAEPALAKLSVVRRELAQRVEQWRQQGDIAGTWLGRLVADIETTLDCNEAFFALETGRDDHLPLAERCSGAALVRWPHEPAALRVRGAVHVGMGRVDLGLKLLRRAWYMGEPRHEAALCACQIAWGHALCGNGRAARRFLGKARRLAAHCYVLPRYTGLVERALAAAQT